MNIIKDDGQYLAIDVRDTSCEGKYQLVRRTVDYPNGETCGVYYSKKDVLVALKEMSHD